MSAQAFVSSHNSAPVPSEPPIAAPWRLPPLRPLALLISAYSRRARWRAPRRPCTHAAASPRRRAVFYT